MKVIQDLQKAAQQALDKAHVALNLECVSFQIYQNSPLQFNATLEGNCFPTVKFEERIPGRFTVAVAPEDGASIDYTQAKVFTMDEPFENLAAAFPQSRDMQQLVTCLINSR